MKGKGFRIRAKILPEAQKGVQEEGVGKPPLCATTELVCLSISQLADKAQLDERAIKGVFGEVTAALAGGDIGAEKNFHVPLDGADRHLLAGQRLRPSEQRGSEGLARKLR